SSGSTKAPTTVESRRTGSSPPTCGACTSRTCTSSRRVVTPGPSGAGKQQRPTWPHRGGLQLVRSIRTAGATLVSAAIVVAATGWLYEIRPHAALPGPPIPDSLPLDELSRHSAVPLLVFLAVWGTAALLL